MDSMIGAPDVAKMSLCRNFGSKDQLIVECLQRLDIRYYNWSVQQVRERTEQPTEALLPPVRRTE
jgi:hypothetical protein